MKFLEKVLLKALSRSISKVNENLGLGKLYLTGLQKVFCKFLQGFLNFHQVFKRYFFGRFLV